MQTHLLAVAGILVLSVGCFANGRAGSSTDPSTPGPDGGSGGPGRDSGPIVVRDGGSGPVPDRDAAPRSDGGPGPGLDAGPGPGDGGGGSTLSALVGTPCSRHADCGEAGYCLQPTSDGTETGFLEGYCVAVGCDAAACPSGSECWLLGTDSTAVCIATCATSDDCRDGYACDGDNTCWPGCNDARACPGDLVCDGFCRTPGGGPVGGECSPENPAGTCPSGLYCIDGTCSAPPACDADPFEPNETITAASALPPDRTTTAGRCTGDTDWFAIDVPANKIATVIASLPEPADANLDLYAYEADGTPLGARVYGVDYTPSWARSSETAQESFGFYGGGSGKRYYIKVTGASSGAAGSYALAVRTTPWQDGSVCTAAGYSFLDCTSGTLGNQTLISFPFPSADDPYLGAGYIFDSVSNYRFLRRETMMAVRYALREVQIAFPGTNPLGLIDMCQSDGITPGYDVGDPRHPESTHDQGGNIDVAYYQTVSNNSARVICDASGGHNDGAFCTAGAASTHIVDLERSVYFVIAMAKTRRLRIVGLDRVIGPLMADAASNMAIAGKITHADHQLFLDSTTWGDGWPYHLHHMHVSMQWL